MCSKWSNLAMNTIELTADSTDCFNLQDWLSWQCCDNVPTLSEYETTTKQMILTDGTPITQMVVPIMQGATLVVKVSAYVSDVSIVNYGVDSAAVEVTVQEDDIWVPKLLPDGHEETNVLEELDIDVLADGCIFWNQEICI
eukprot:15325775-Ditylum_brightwellii.AAC.1